MAKASKFAALAEFRQHPPEPDEADAVLVAAEPAGNLAEESGAAGAVAVAPEEPATVAEPEPLDPVAPPRRTRTAKAAPPPPLPPPRPRGRPPGKRSDPEWKLFSHFLKRSTQRQATAILFETEADEDLSDVLQTLLEKWVAGQRAKM